MGHSFGKTWGSVRDDSGSQTFASPLWRAVLRFWFVVGVLTLLALRDVHSGPERWLLLGVVLFGGAAALLIAWVSRLWVPDRRVLYSAWSAAVIMSAFLAALLRLGAGAAAALVTATTLMTYLVTCARLRSAR